MIVGRRPLAIAHRGTPRTFTENTISGVLEAIRLGADAVEVDVRAARDGVAVLHHDRTLARLWGRTEAIGDLTFDQLRSCAPRIPSLAEMLTAVEVYAVPLVLDVGSVPAAQAAALAVAAHPIPVPDAAVWFCGDPRALAWLRAEDVPHPRMLSWDRWTTPVARMLAAVAPVVVNPWHRLLRPDTIKAWHDAGLRVCSWTVDTGARRRCLLRWGVDAMISNDVVGVVRDVARFRDLPTVPVPS